jgi:hypothetical protein
MKSPHPNPLPLNGRGNSNLPSPFQREKVARFAPDEGESLSRENVAQRKTLSFSLSEGEGGAKRRMRVN